MRTPGSADVTYRPAVEADLPAGSAVFNRAQQDPSVRRGFAWDDRPLELFAGPQRHILGTDPGRACVAERAGSVVGMPRPSRADRCGTSRRASSTRPTRVGGSAARSSSCVPRTRRSGARRWSTRTSRSPPGSTPRRA